MNRICTAIATLLLCLTVSASLTYAECPCKGKEQSARHGSIDMNGPGCPRMSLMLMHRQDLKLTDDQANKIKALQTDLIRTNTKTMAEVKIARMDLGDMLSGMNPDFGGIKNQMKKISDLELQAGTAKVDTYGKAFGLLNNDQKTKYYQLWTDMEAQGSDE